MSVPKLLFSSLLLVFLLGPNFKHLHAQETTRSASVDLIQTTLKTDTQFLSVPFVTESSTEASIEMSTQSAATTGHPITTSETILTTALQGAIVATTISDILITSSQASSSTMKTHAITMAITEKIEVKDPTTFPNEEKSTVSEEKPEETTLGLVPTTIATKTPVQSTTSEEMSESFTQPPVKTTPSRTKTTLTEITYSTQPKKVLFEPDHDDLTTEQPKAGATTDVIESVSQTGLSGEQSPDEGQNKLLIIIIIITVAVVCIVTVCCIIFVKHKQKNKQGNINGRNQRSKKKKGTEEDAWAGPVKLGAGEKAECDGVEEGSGQGDDKDGDMVLSTFAVLEEGELNNGVGQQGSKEAKKWEEQEPLLYIDEEVKGEGQEKGEDKAKDDGHKGKEDSNGILGQTGKNQVELNGAEAFCLTTAV